MQVLAPDRLYQPAGHVAAVGDVDPPTHAYPALQLLVHRGDVKPDPEPNRPGSQGPLQLDVAIAAVAPYLPAAHWVHAPTLPVEY